MQVPLKSTARPQILEKLASKILKRKSSRKDFSSALFFVKLERLFLHIGERSVAHFQNQRAKPHENVEFNLRTNHANFGGFNLQHKCFVK